jgi:hypothetical protein
MSFLHRTNTGRVVYDRPRNFFKYRAVGRILKNLYVDYPDPFDSRVLDVAYWGIQNLQARAVDGGITMLDYLVDYIPELPEGAGIVVKLIDVWVNLSRRIHSSIFRTTKPRNLFPISPGDLLDQGEVAEETGSAIGDPFLSALLSARDQLENYLKEVGYGTSEA